MEAFKAIESESVAVRSSSTVEDLPGMSFAGQYTTYLNVTEADLVKRVVECWKSLWNLEAMEYRNKNGIAPGFSHAVVIQAMVPAAVAGVAFTANPMNGLRNQLVINASYGLGEAIVSGEVNPDQFVVDRETGKVTAQIVNEKKTRMDYGGCFDYGIRRTHEPWRDCSQRVWDSSGRRHSVGVEDAEERAACSGKWRNGNCGNFIKPGDLNSRTRSSFGCFFCVQKQIENV